ncbi:hypothetical protein PAMC26510_25615 [Caballeronia sordidicola]|uniref:Uncharacterized protein n=1 Tax=Caballeronia sordidicola TaxID=196367 RepID=A0A242MGF8_CABSO|nr:hypothetical protein PAMC26510_25615 [Caballeronia sordidicola]
MEQCQSIRLNGSLLNGQKIVLGIAVRHREPEAVSVDQGPLYGRATYRRA